MIFPITHRTDGYFGIGLTKFLQVVHGVHVVHSLAIEVEPGGSKVSVSGIQEKGNLVGSPGIFDNGCFWETCRPTGVDVKNLHAGFICSGWERAICTWALIIMRMKKTTMIQTMTLSLKLSLLLTDSGTSVDGWFGNSWSRLTAWVSRWECSGGSSLTLFQSPIPDAPSGRWDTWWERMLSLLLISCLPPAGVHQLDLPRQLGLDVANCRGELPAKDDCCCKRRVYAAHNYDFSNRDAWCHCH